MKKVSGINVMGHCTDVLCTYINTWVDYISPVLWYQGLHWLSICNITASEPNVGKDDEQTSLEELLAFIEGGDGDENEQTMTSKVSKRQKRKQKKVYTLFMRYIIIMY